MWYLIKCLITSRFLDCLLPKDDKLFILLTSKTEFSWSRWFKGEYRVQKTVEIPLFEFIAVYFAWVIIAVILGAILSKYYGTFWILGIFAYSSSVIGALLVCLAVKLRTISILRSRENGYK